MGQIHFDLCTRFTTESVNCFTIVSNDSERTISRHNELNFFIMETEYQLFSNDVSTVDPKVDSVKSSRENRLESWHLSWYKGQMPAYLQGFP